MTFRYRSDTFALPAAAIPAQFSTTTELMLFIEQQMQRGREALQAIASGPCSPSLDSPGLDSPGLDSPGRTSPCQTHAAEALERALVLHGSSSSGWFERVLENLLDASGSRHLGFLTEKDEVAPFTWPDENWRFRCTVLDAQAVAQAAAEVRILIRWCSEHPALTGELLDWYAADEVTAAIACADVMIDVAAYIEEGLGPAYLFAYLRSLQHLLDCAQAAGLHVLHFQKHPDEAQIKAQALPSLLG